MKNRQIEITGNLELVPHVRLEPQDYRTNRKGKQFHRVPKRQRDAYWAESFAQAGIEGVHQIASKSSAARLDSIHDERILSQILKQIQREIADDPDGMKKTQIYYYVDNGLSLLHEGKVIYGAQCCSDLGNIDQWEKALDYKSAKWTDLWNGHPMIPFYYENGMLRFSELSDDKPQRKSDWIYAIPVDLLEDAVIAARIEVDDFVARFWAYYQAQQNK